jgi:hypothetical protein
MSASRNWSAKKADGRIDLDDKDGFRQWFGHFGEGEEITLRVGPPKRFRTYDQLRYWFGHPMKLLSEHTGYTKMQMHYLCLAICFGVVLDPVTGREVPVVPMSKQLTTAQFSELIEWVGPWARETYGVSIGLPGDIDIESLPGYESAEDAA